MNTQQITTYTKPDSNRHLDRALAVAVVLVALVASVLGSGSVSNAAPDKSRIDRAKPTFSNPTSITHPLFPKSKLSQVIQLGAEGRDKLRFEVTQLPKTHVVRWNGKKIETRVTHFVAYMNGRILEIAVDFYAQADDGSVWYFGENVDNYENGVIADHEGTWLAGKDGPPGMIMPAHPRVGNVYRPENIPGLVFEEVTVKATGKTVRGPRGPIAGAVAVREHLMDGTREDKVYAPGYGEFRASVASLHELYHVALAVPVDALPGRMPREIARLSAGAASVFEAARSTSWDRSEATIEGMIAAWDTYQSRAVPRLLAVQMTDALRALDAAIEARKPAAAAQAAIDVGQASVDLQLRYRPVAEVDHARLGLWKRQLVLDRAAGGAAAVKGDLATMRAIAARS
jgi:hypothetical protein